MVEAKGSRIGGALSCYEPHALSAFKMEDRPAHRREPAGNRPSLRNSADQGATHWVRKYFGVAEIALVCGLVAPITSAYVPFAVDALCSLAVPVVGDSQETTASLPMI